MLMTESNQQDEQQVEKIIDILVRLFIYIYSRDLFFDHYRKFLCNRLLNKTSKNIEMEKNVVAKLKVIHANAHRKKKKNYFFIYALFSLLPFLPSSPALVPPALLRKTRAHWKRPFLQLICPKLILRLDLSAYSNRCAAYPIPFYLKKK